MSQGRHLAKFIPFKREIRAAKNLGFIIIFFFLCWFPLYTSNCIHFFVDAWQPSLPLTDFFVILSHLNSAINPLLYAYHLNDVRDALRNLVRCKKSGNAGNKGGN
jgi:hypothetical protein